MNGLPYYIIEHPRQGTFREFLDSGKPGFSWSGMRNDSDRAQRFPTLESAQRVRDRFPHAVASECVILASPAATGDQYRNAETGALV
jgi:hypothetical protein